MGLSETKSSADSLITVNANTVVGWLFCWFVSCFSVSLSLLLSVPQPCQTIYQVFHDAVTRLIQYGVLYVAEVSLQIGTSLLVDRNESNRCD